LLAGFIPLGRRCGVSGPAAVPGFRLLFSLFVSVIWFFLVSAFGAFPAAMPLHGATHSSTALDAQLERRSQTAALEFGHICAGPLSEALSETCQSEIDCWSESVEHGNNAAQKFSSLGGLYGSGKGLLLRELQVGYRLHRRRCRNLKKSPMI